MRHLLVGAEQVEPGRHGAAEPGVLRALGVEQDVLAGAGVAPAVTRDGEALAGGRARLLQVGVEPVQRLVEDEVGLRVAAVVAAGDPGDLDRRAGGRDGPGVEVGVAEREQRVALAPG